MSGSGAQRNTTTEDEAGIGMPETQQGQFASRSDSMITHILANPIQDRNLPQLTRFLNTEGEASEETLPSHLATNTSAGPATNTSAGPATNTSARPSTGTSAGPSTYTLAGPSTNTLAGPSINTLAGPSINTLVGPSTNTSPSNDEATNILAGPSTSTSAGPFTYALPSHQSDTTNSPPSPNYSVSQPPRQESGLQPNTTVDSDDELDQESILSIIESDSGSSLAL